MNIDLDRLENLVAPALQAEGVELVDLTYQKESAGWVLRLTLDKPGGITLDDCSRWSDSLGNLVEESGLILQAYNLEVSSPGIDRVLRKTVHFQKFYGQRVSIRLFEPLNGQRNFHGYLTHADEQTVRIKLEDADREVSLERKLISKAKLDPLLKF